MGRSPLLCAIFFLSFLTSAVAEENGGCALWTFAPFTRNGTEHSMSDVGNNLGFSHMAAALLAMDHFNRRDSSVVPELGGANYSYDKCNIFFNDSSLVFDTETMGPNSVHSVLEQFKMNEIKPCAIAGPRNDQPGTDLSVVASSIEVPLVGYGGWNVRTVIDFYHPFSSKVTGSSVSSSYAAYSFLDYIGRSSLVSVLYPLRDSGLHIREGLFFDAELYGTRMESRSYSIDRTDLEAYMSVRNALARLKANGFRTILAVVDVPSTEIPYIADAAEELGLNNGDYFWAFIAIDLNYFGSKSALENSNVTKLTRGGVVFSELEGFVLNPEEDKFLSSWQQQNASFVERANRMNPIAKGQPGYYFAEDDYFQTIDPETGAGFLYDAVMSIGMGLCNGQKLDGGDFPSGSSRLKGVRSSDFHGASGRVHFGNLFIDAAGARSLDTLRLGSFNFQNHAYVLTDVVEPNRGHGKGTWTNLQPFLYADGTTNPPELLRDTPEQNYLDEGVRIFGFTFMGIALFTILLSAAWVYFHRNTRIVKASQPLFLYILAFGSLIQTMSILLMSWDESYGATAVELGKACTALPWLVMLGHIFVYSALFSKLWRINKVMQFRRAKVEIKHVAWPSFVIVILAIILLSIWTALGGFDWVRTETDELTGESIGHCEADNLIAFIVPWAVLMAIPTILTIILAWKTKDVDAAYSESSWIFSLVMTHLQVIVISAPVLYILHTESTNAKYIGFVLVIWVLVMSNMLLIVGPKVYTFYFVKPDQQKMSRGGGSGGVKISGLRASQEKPHSTVYSGMSVEQDALPNGSERLDHTGSSSADMVDSRSQDPVHSPGEEIVCRTSQEPEEGIPQSGSEEQGSTLAEDASVGRSEEPKSSQVKDIAQDKALERPGHSSTKEMREQQIGTGRPQTD